MAITFHFQLKQEELYYFFLTKQQIDQDCLSQIYLKLIYCDSEQCLQWGRRDGGREREKDRQRDLVNNGLLISTYFNMDLANFTSLL